ncbi:MAG: mechanosensitive ion channel family protein [Gemmatimonadales bacterium]
MLLGSMNLVELAIPLAAAVAGLVLGLVVRHVVFGRLVRRAAATRARFDDLLVSAFRGPVVLWGTILGLYVAAELASLPREVQTLVQRMLLVLVIFSVTWTAAGLAGTWMRRAAAEGESPLPAASLITNLARIVVFAVGFLVILQTLGISITPIITALGVGGLAVALALQDTLANLFAGIHILATRQIRPGDFVRLESGDEGFVQDITWRNTTIRRLPNDLVIVPNAKLAGAVTTNYHLPDMEEAVLVGVGVSYSSDLAHVERVTVAVAREVMQQVENGVPSFEPFVRYNAFGDSSINLTVILRGRDFVAQHLIRHEFIKRLHARYAQEGIEIPFPQRTLHWGKGSAEALADVRSR